MLSVLTCSLAFSPSLSPPRQTNQWSTVMPSSLEKCTAGPGDSRRVHPHSLPRSDLQLPHSLQQTAPTPFHHWLSAVTKGLIPKQGFSDGSVIYLCLPPTWEGQASKQHCSCCLTHLAPPLGPTLLSAHPNVGLPSFPSPHTYRVCSVFHAALFPLLFTYFLCVWLFKESWCSPEQYLFFFF